MDHIQLLLSIKDSASVQPDHLGGLQSSTSPPAFLQAMHGQDVYIHNCMLLPVLLPPTGELAAAKSVVVYAGFKAAADSLAAQLQRAQVTARPYHAGLNMQQRESVQVGASQRRAAQHGC
jgi:hypothetical protein